MQLMRDNLYTAYYLRLITMQKPHKGSYDSAIPGKTLGSSNVYFPKLNLKKINHSFYYHVDIVIGIF